MTQEHLKNNGLPVVIILNEVYPVFKQNHVACQLSCDVIGCEDS